MLKPQHLKVEREPDVGAGVDNDADNDYQSIDQFQQEPDLGEPTVDSNNEDPDKEALSRMEECNTVAEILRAIAFMIVSVVGTIYIGKFDNSLAMLFASAIGTFKDTLFGQFPIFSQKICLRVFLKAIMLMIIFPMVLLTYHQGGQSDIVDGSILLLTSLHYAYQINVGFRPINAARWNKECQRGKLMLLEVFVCAVLIDFWIRLYNKKMKPDQDKAKRVIIILVFLDDHIDSQTMYDIYTYKGDERIDALNKKALFNLLVAFMLAFIPIVYSSQFKSKSQESQDDYIEIQSLMFEAGTLIIYNCIQIFAALRFLFKLYRERFIRIG